MLRCCVWFVLLAGGLLLTGGCSTTPAGAAAQSEYRPPAPGPDAGSLVGVRRRIGFLADDHVGYVLLVDRKFVVNARKSWNRPIPLAAGPHVITAEYQFGPYMARADITLDVKPGTRYELRIMNGTEPPDGARFNDFWIVDAGGAVVSQVHHSAVSGGSNYNPFSVN